MPGAARLGRITTRFGASMLVEGPDGLLCRCTARRAARDAVCGDWVQWGESERGDPVIFAREPRRNSLTRPDKRGQPLTIAANIDRLLVVIAPSPDPNWEMVDRYLVAAEDLRAEALILVNKHDLRDEAGWAGSELGVYAGLGYGIVHVSAQTGYGWTDMNRTLREGTSILVGQSGVGKSSLVRALLPDLDIRIGAISAATGRGRHTTTAATLYPLPCGGQLIDSPGVRDFALPPLEPGRIAQGFPELRTHAARCRFPDCRHTVEPGCAVRKALERGEINERRYRSYRALVTTDA
jgi:ribosome biogenesis GTPase